MLRKIIIFKSLLILLIISGCSTLNIQNINQYYKDRYSELRFYQNTKDIENIRKKVLKQEFGFYTDFKSLTIIEIYRYPNGNFDDVWSYFYFYKNNKLNKIIFYRSKNKKVEYISINKKGLFLLTMNKIEALFYSNRAEKIFEMSENYNYSVNEAGTIYMTMFDEEFNIVKGIKFKEFLINDAPLPRE